MAIKKGDKVRVIAGSDRGSEGTVEKVLVKEGKVLVGGINMKKKHMRARAGMPGQILEIATPLDVSNVQLIDPKTKKPTRVSYKVMNGKKVRIAQKSGNEV